MFQRVAGRVGALRNSDRGETLLELMMAVAIIAIAGVALIGAVLMSITSSTEHRSLTLNDLFLKTYVNTAIQKIQRATTPAYSGCASSYNIPAPADMPATYTIGISSIKYWNGNSWVSSCPGGSPPQLITAAVKSPTQGTSTLSFAVRGPATLS